MLPTRAGVVPLPEHLEALQVPHGVAVDPQGRVIVADSDNKRVSVFDKDGRFMKVIADAPAAPATPPPASPAK